jgi:hypothetical protein
MWADVSSVVVPASGSVSAFFSVIIVDITKRKLAEEKLHQKEISLREAQTEMAYVSRVRTMGELAASIAHGRVAPPLHRRAVSHWADVESAVIAGAGPSASGMNS